MVIHCYCYCNKVSLEVKRFSGRFIDEIYTIVATFIDIIATFLIIIATLGVIVATIQFPPNPTRFPLQKSSLSRKRRADKDKDFHIYPV